MRYTVYHVLPPLPYYDLFIVCKVCPFTALFITLYSVYAGVCMTVGDNNRVQQQQSKPCNYLYPLHIATLCGAF